MFGKKNENMFDLAKKTGKKIVFILFEDKVFMTLADKKEDGTISFLIKKDYGEGKYKLQITPDQEFLLHSPKVQMKPEALNIFEYLLNFDMDIKVENPKDVQFSLQPYDVECLFLVYPHEILSVETLKSLGLVELPSDIKKEHVQPDGSRKLLSIKAFSPSIFTLDKRTIKLLSAKSRISQIDTILSMTRELLLKSEGLYGIERPNLFRVLLNRRIIIPIVLIIIILIAALMLAGSMGTMTQALGSMTTPMMQITPTFP